MLVEIGHDQRLAVAQDPAYQPLARLDGAALRDAVPQAEGGNQTMKLSLAFRVFLRQEENGGIGVENAADDAQDVLFKDVVHRYAGMTGVEGMARHHGRRRNDTRGRGRPQLPRVRRFFCKTAGKGLEIDGKIS